MQVSIGGGERGTKGGPINQTLKKKQSGMTLYNLGLSFTKNVFISVCFSFYTICTPFIIFCLFINMMKNMSTYL